MQLAALKSHVHCAYRFSSILDTWRKGLHCSQSSKIRKLSSRAFDRSHTNHHYARGFQPMTDSPLGRIVDAYGVFRVHHPRSHQYLERNQR